MSGESNTALDQLEAALFHEARQELAPDQGRIDNIWQSVAAASTFGAAISGIHASVPPASGTDWAAPSLTAPPSAAPAPKLQNAGLLQRLGQTSFGLRALALAAVGGAALGFAAGYGSAQQVLDPPGRATTVSSSAAKSSAVSDAEMSQASQAPEATPSDEPQAPTAAPGSSTKPRTPSSSKAGSSEHGSSEQSAESAKPSFYEELQYLKRAQSALRQGNGALALGLMTELDSIQPGGALLSERGVTQVLAHCQLGNVDKAERVARRLAAQGLASVYTERLEHSCAGAVLAKP